MGLFCVNILHPYPSVRITHVVFSYCRKLHNLAQCDYWSTACGMKMKPQVGPRYAHASIMVEFLTVAELAECIPNTVGVRVCILNR